MPITDMWKNAKTSDQRDISSPQWLNLKLTGFIERYRKSPDQHTFLQTTPEHHSSANRKLYKLSHLPHLYREDKLKSDLYVPPAASQSICNLTCINISILQRSNPGVKTNEPSAFTSVESVPGACLVSKNQEFSTFTARNVRKHQPWKLCHVLLSILDFTECESHTFRLRCRWNINTSHTCMKQRLLVLPWLRKYGFQCIKRIWVTDDA